MHQSIDKKNKVVLYLIFLLLLSTTSWKFLKQQEKYSFNINKIIVVGLSEAKNLEIKNNLNSIFYQNIFILRKKEIHNIINKHNIIEEYSIKKIYPTTLDINIKPAKIIAKISGDNQLVVGSNGKLIINDFSGVVVRARNENNNIKIYISIGGGYLTDEQALIWSNSIDIKDNRPIIINEIVSFR